MKERKGRRPVKRMRVRPMPEIDRNEMDKNIFDVVLKYLYVNADKNSLDLNNDILSHMTVPLPEREKKRVWDVLTSSGWVSPIIGFGQAGKIELTKAGFQLMSQFGSYTDYMAAMQNNPVQASPINAPVSVNEPNKAIEPPKEGPGKQARRYR